MTGKVCVGVIIILLLPTFIEVFAQVEEQEGNSIEGTPTPTKMTVELSCETGPNSNLLCWNSELGLCILRTDLNEVGGGNIWNVMNSMLWEAGE